jgi:hypothetical protein
MIQLKSEVNKSAVMRKLHLMAIKIYENSYQSSSHKDAFIKGAENLLNLLRLKENNCKGCNRPIEPGNEYCAECLCEDDCEL